MSERFADSLPAHALLEGAAPAELLGCLPAMGRVMVIGRVPGVTHERIGPVAAVAAEGALLRLKGAAQGGLVDPAPVARMRLDCRSRMRDKLYPRLDFLDADGAVLFAVVGMDGPEPFAAALAPLRLVPAAPPPEPPAEPPAPAAAEARPDLAEDDPAHAAFAEVVKAGAEVAIRLTRPGLVQEWRGRIAAVKPAMGFLNVMTPDFHLHLAGGSLSGWAAGPGCRRALGRDGRPLGLDLVSDAFA